MLNAFRAIDLCHFAIFGLQQDTNVAYAAVIPKWTSAMIASEPITVNGNGQTSRDFCFVANAVQAILLAACAPNEVAGDVFNVAVGARTSLPELFDSLRSQLGHHQVHYDLSRSTLSSERATSSTARLI